MPRCNVDRPPSVGWEGGAAVRTQGGREGGKGLAATFTPHVGWTRKNPTHGGVRARNRGPSVRALPGPLRCRPHRRAPFADVTPSTERCRHFQRNSIPSTTFRGPLCFEFHPTPRSVRATGQTEALVVANAFIIMGPVLAEPLISPVDLHRLQATALGFI